MYTKMEKLTGILNYRSFGFDSYYDVLVCNHKDSIFQNSIPEGVKWGLKKHISRNG